MPGAPAVREAIDSPLGVDMQKRQVVAFWHEELLARGVRLFLALFRTVENGRNREHGNNGEHLLTALILHASNDQLGERRIHREGCHRTTERCKVANVVKSTKGPQIEE